MIVIALLSAVCSWFCLRALIPILSRRLLDRPNARSSHTLPTPRGGGLVFVFVFLIASSLLFLVDSGDNFALIPILAIPLAFVGLIDDALHLPASLRFCAHFITALLMLGISPLVNFSDYSFDTGSWYCLFIPLLLLIAVISVINFTNFMDGLDGLVAGCMSVALASASLVLDVPWTLWVLVGSLLGFLFWNWSPSKVFMGDVGSTFLGAVFVGLILQAPSWLEACGCLLVATPLLGDAFFCVVRRLLAGQSVFQAHRLHLYQRLHQSGWSHARVSLLYILATVVLAAALVLGGSLCVFGFAVLMLISGFFLDRFCAVPFRISA